MLPTVAAFITAATLGAADLHAANRTFATLPPFVTALPGSVALHSPTLEAQSRHVRDDAERAAQHHRRHHGGGSSAAPSSTTGEPAGDAAPAAADAPAASSPASTTAPAADAASTTTTTTTTASASATTEAPAAEAAASDTAATDDEPDIELIRHREHQVRTHRILGFTTLGSLVVTEVLGTILAINEGTLFSHGCSCVDFAALTPLHLTSSFITVSLYATTGIFALTLPDPEHASAGHDTRGEHLRWHQRMAWVHFIGMTLMPILGIAASMPGLFGVNGSGVGDFQNAMRTIHLGVGYITLAALTTAMVFEL